MNIPQQILRTTIVVEVPTLLGIIVYTNGLSVLAYCVSALLYVTALVRIPYTRRLLLPPQIGDPVAGYLDYGVRYEGVVVRFSEDKELPCAYIKGRTIVSNGLRLIATEYEDLAVPTNKLLHARK